MKHLLAAKRMGITVALALWLAGCAAVDTTQVQTPGVPAPNFTLVSLSNRAVTLSDFKGTKNVVLVFYFGHD
jgi:cytochrome oxidase Cu insertion factor (SCO1/SenC/PrrC family)